MDKPKILHRDVLAERLGVDKHRVSLEVMQADDNRRIVAVECLIDGKDLTAEQEAIFHKFLAEYAGIEKILMTGPSLDS